MYINGHQEHCQGTSALEGELIKRIIKILSVLKKKKKSPEVLNQRLFAQKSSKGSRGLMQGVVAPSLSRVQLFATPWTAACQASLSFSISLGLLKLMSTESVVLSNVVHCRREWQITSVFLPHEQNSMNSMKGQKCKVSAPESRRPGDGMQKFAGESSGSPLLGKGGHGN